MTFCKKGITLDATTQFTFENEFQNDGTGDAANGCCHGFTHATCDALGRIVMTDHAEFVLINVYCPSGGGKANERAQAKLDFYKVLERQCELLVQAGRAVLVVSAKFSLGLCVGFSNWQAVGVRRWVTSTVHTMRLISTKRIATTKSLAFSLWNASG